MSLTCWLEILLINYSYTDKLRCCQRFFKGTILFNCLLLVPHLDQHTKGIKLGLNSTCIKLQNSSVQCSLNSFGHSITFVDNMDTFEEYAKNENFTDCPLTWNNHICLQILEMNMGVNQRNQYFDPSFEACTCKLNCSENHFKTSEKKGKCTERHSGCLLFCLFLL